MIMEKIVQGISERSENISPIFPAVEGIAIKIPEVSPQTASDFLN